jgi:Icc-related predicted phosphoesterase
MTPEAKVLLVGDIHAMDRPPATVNDSYMDDLIDMLEWIAHHAAESGHSTVVWAGDIFNHKMPSRTSHALVLRMIGVVQLYLELGVELLIVVGNHDISNDVLSSVDEKQPLGVLLKSGAKELNGWHDGGLPLFGVPWQQRWLYEDTPFNAFIGWREDQPRFGGKDLSKSLAVTHAPIYPPKEAENILFELVPTKGEHGLSAAMENTGYLYYGHIHEDHGIFEVEGVTYANMGALSRGSLTEYNIEREIKVASWTPEGGFVEVPVPHKPASEVFKIQPSLDAKAEKKNLDAFLTEVSTSVLDISSTEGVISHIKSMEHVDRNVRLKAIEILESIE